MRHAFRPALVGLCLVLCGGCVEVKESLELRSGGAVAYTLVVRWDEEDRQALLRLAGEHAGRFEGRSFPLDAAPWRDSLEACEGLTRRHAEVEEDGAQRVLRVQAEATDLRHLLSWEFFARRRLLLHRQAGTDEEVDRVVLVMDPLVRVPWLDPIAAALAADAEPPPERRPGEEPLDPLPVEALDLPPQTVQALRALLEPALARVLLEFEVRVPVPVQETGPHGEVRDGAARFVLGCHHLRHSPQRALRLTWLSAPTEPLLEIDHSGDRPDDPAEAVVPR